MRDYLIWATQKLIERNCAPSLWNDENVWDIFTDYILYNRGPIPAELSLTAYAKTL